MDVVMVIFHTYGSAISSPKHNAAVNVSCCSSEVAAICTHDFMHNEHAGVCTALVYYIRKVLCSLLCRGERAKCLLDWADVVVDCLGQTNHCKVRGVVLEIDCKFSTYCVSANGVQHFDPVLLKLLGSHLLWILALCDETLFDAPLHVAQLHAAAAERAAPMQVQHSCIPPRLGGDNKAFAFQQTPEATLVADYFDVGTELVVALNEATHSRADAWCESTCCHDCHFLWAPEARCPRVQGKIGRCGRCQRHRGLDFCHHLLEPRL
mmetsp:Transcript_92526/g.163644  ORF Transcript_92526/g.163644 Transcript_92526/m.163644 type:complete len:265 (-) Transcript_92526:1561-2355(-)